MTRATGADRAGPEPGLERAHERTWHLHARGLVCACRGIPHGTSIAPPLAKGAGGRWRLAFGRGLLADGRVTASAAFTRFEGRPRPTSIADAVVVDVTLYTDAACPWAYSANPALRVLEWRYGDQLAWRLVTIGLRDEVSPGAAQAYDRAGAAARQLLFRSRYRMPFAPTPKARATATGRGCRAVVAARLSDPGSEWRVLRALQFATFTTPLLLDEDDQIREVLRAVPGLDPDAIVGRLDDEDVHRAYEVDRAEARRAAGSAAESQGKTSTSDGPVRFTAPSLVFESSGDRLVAGGWQPILAYDVLLANLNPALRRTPPPESPEPLLAHFADGLTTAEAAALLADGPDPVSDHESAERALLELVADGEAVRIPLAQDALWHHAKVRSADPHEQSAAVSA